MHLRRVQNVYSHWHNYPTQLHRVMAQKTYFFVKSSDEVLNLRFYGKHFDEISLISMGYQPRTIINIECSFLSFLLNNRLLSVQVLNNIIIS